MEGRHRQSIPANPSNYPYFMKTVGGLERFKEIMVWLPTWYDAREIVRRLDVSDQEVFAHLRETEAFESGRERLALYNLIASRIAAAPTAVIDRAPAFGR